MKTNKSQQTHYCLWFFSYNRFLTSIILILLTCTGFAQKQKKLYYFTAKDGKVGVKSKSGKIIIPANFFYAEYDNDDDTKAIKSSLIYMYKNSGESKSDYGFINCFNRKGEFLYHPFFIDNGPDYFAEGLQRFVENNKMGFANRKGEKAIPATFDYVAPFEYGLAAFCQGCQLKIDSADSGDPHPMIVGGEWGLIDKKGNIRIPEGKYSSRSYIPDSLANANPPLFSYSELEKQLISSVENIPDIYHLLTFNHSPTPKKIIFEITERPGTDFPYYTIKLFFISEGYISEHADDCFLISAKTRKIAVSIGEEGYYLKSLEEWLKRTNAIIKERKKDK